MGGSVRTHNELGKGIRMSLDLLLRQCRPKIPEPGQNPLAASTEPSRRLRIFITGDYPPNRILLHQQLEFLGRRVAEAEDGQVALEPWADERFEVLISDRNIPCLDGYQPARRIRIQERYGWRAPILILGYATGAEPDGMQRCRDAGMDDCLFKPLNLETLRNYLATSFGRDVAQPRGLYDANALSSLGGGCPERLRELLETLLGDSRQDLQRLAIFLCESDGIRLVKRAHCTKGAVRTIGTRAPLKAYEALEDACQRGGGGEYPQASGERLRLALEVLQEELQEQLAAAAV